MERRRQTMAVKTFKIKIFAPRPDESVVQGGRLKKDRTERGCPAACHNGAREIQWLTDDHGQWNSFQQPFGNNLKRPKRRATNSTFSTQRRSHSVRGVWAFPMIIAHFWSAVPARRHDEAVTTEQPKALSQALGAWARSLACLPDGTKPTIGVQNNQEGVVGQSHGCAAPCRCASHRWIFSVNAEAGCPAHCTAVLLGVSRI